MGIEYYIVNHDRKAGFEMGKNGDWLEFSVATLLYKESLIVELRRIYDPQFYTEANGWTRDYIELIADRLLDFVGDTALEKTEAVIEDQWDELEDQGYRITNGRYTQEVVDPTYEDLRVKEPTTDIEKRLVREWKYLTDAEIKSMLLEYDTLITGRYMAHNMPSPGPVGYLLDQKAILKWFLQERKRTGATPKQKPPEKAFRFLDI
jgi:hypothetical protein